MNMFCSWESLAQFLHDHLLTFAHVRYRRAQTSVHELTQHSGRIVSQCEFPVPVDSSEDVMLSICVNYPVKKNTKLLCVVCLHEEHTQATVKPFINHTYSVQKSLLIGEYIDCRE